MPHGARVVVGLGILSLLSACSVDSSDDESSTDALAEKQDCSQSSSCVVAEAAFKGQITEKLPTEIDSGWLEKGPIKVRTRFTIDPSKDEPLVAVDMAKGALLEASWSPSEKGLISLRPRTAKDAAGEMKVRYTLVPTLQAEIYGVQVNYDSTQLLDKIVGDEFNYDAQSEALLAPWGFEGAQATVPAPKLSESTIFGLPFTKLGVNPDKAEGTLAIQAVARPTFNYKTKEIQLDSAAVRTADGSTKLPIGDLDAVDVIAHVNGEIELAGELDVRPVVSIDTVAGIDTLGLVKYSFSVASKSFGGTSPVSFEPATIHIPLPNVKVPQTPLGLGTAEGGSRLTKHVTIENTGELAAVLKVESSDSKFTVPTAEIRVEPKSTYDLEVAFQPEGSGSSSATITVKSNDPDSPNQSFKVSANGPSEPDVEPEEDEDEPEEAPAPRRKSSDGCSIIATGTNAGAEAPWVIALGLGLLARRRQRKTS